MKNILSVFVLALLYSLTATSCSENLPIDDDQGEQPSPRQRALSQENPDNDDNDNDQSIFSVIVSDDTQVVADTVRFTLRH